MALFVTGVLAIVFFNAMGGDKEEGKPKPYALGPDNALSRKWFSGGRSDAYRAASQGYDSVGYANRPADYALGGSTTEPNLSQTY